MHIISLGLNHLTAPVALRERLALNENQIRSSLSRYFSGQGKTCLAEFVILSTCGRIEVYAASNQLAYDELEAFLSDAKGESLSDLQPYFYRFQDLEAARHLFNVAAGLDSPLIGEPQILGQITRAMEWARSQNAAGPTLNRLFQSAIHAGKRARSETEISRNAVSVSSLAASIAEKYLVQIKTAMVVVLGAGEMAELTVEALRKRGVEKIRVMNRTLERAQTVASRWGAEPATFEFLYESLLDADIVISSTGAPHFVISAQTVANAMRSRGEHALVLIDIAVPRDIDPEARNIPHVRLLDIDGLHAQLEESRTRRLEEVPKVRQILQQEFSEFERYWRSKEILPIITDIYERAESIRANELEKTLRRLPDLTDTERERIETLTQSLVRKLLDPPTRRLREEAITGRAPEYVALMRSLFNLEDMPTPSSSTVMD